MSIIYVLKTESDPPMFKIGRTSGMVEKRIQSLQTGCPYPIREYASFQCNDSGKVEREIHEHLDGYRLQGEWFQVPTDELDRVLDEYNDDPVVPYVEQVWDNGYRTLTRMVDLAVFVSLDAFPRTQKITYLATGETIISGNGDAWVNLDELEKDYPELTEHFSQFRLKATWPMRQWFCSKCGTGKPFLEQRGSATGSARCRQCGHRWPVSLV